MYERLVMVCIKQQSKQFIQLIEKMFQIVKKFKNMLKLAIFFLILLNFTQIQYLKSFSPKFQAGDVLSNILIFGYFSLDVLTKSVLDKKKEFMHRGSNTERMGGDGVRGKMLENACF